MKRILLTLGAVSTLAVGAVAFDREKPVEKIPDIATTTTKVALPAQAVQGWMNSQGVNHTNAPHVYQMLVDEEPPTVDISQVSLEDVAMEFMALLDEDDVDTALNGKSANAIILEKAQQGIARKKPINNFTNP